MASLHSVPRRLFFPPTACGQRTLYISELGRRFRWNKILEPDVYPGGKAVVVKGNGEGWEKWENVCVRGICFNVDASTKYNTRIKFGIGVTQRSRPTTPLPGGDNDAIKCVSMAKLLRPRINSVYVLTSNFLNIPKSLTNTEEKGFLFWLLS